MGLVKRCRLRTPTEQRLRPTRSTRRGAEASARGRGRRGRLGDSGGRLARVLAAAQIRVGTRDLGALTTEYRSDEEFRRFSRKTNTG